MIRSLKEEVWRIYTCGGLLACLAPFITLREYPAPKTEEEKKVYLLVFFPLTFHSALFFLSFSYLADVRFSSQHSSLPHITCWLDITTSNTQTAFGQWSIWRRKKTRWTFATTLSTKKIPCSSLSSFPLSPIPIRRLVTIWLQHQRPDLDWHEYDWDVEERRGGDS